MPTRHHRLFGLAIASDLALPDLAAVKASTAPDVRISLGAVDAVPGDAQQQQPIAGGAVLAIDGVARFAIIEGNRIIVDPDPAAAPRNVRLYLLGSVMGMLLHQRGILPLHANAVEIDGKAFAFMGKSGAGKSTLAAWFHDRGYRVIADDVCAVTFDQRGRAVVSPGLPRLRLWDDALTATGRSSGDYSRSYVGDDEWNKYDVPVGSEEHGAKPIELGGIYCLDQGEASAIRLIVGVAAFSALSSNTYRGSYLSLAGQPALHLDACARLARSTPLFVATRRWGYEHFDGECARLIDHARESSTNRPLGVN